LIAGLELKLENAEGAIKNGQHRVTQGEEKLNQSTTQHVLDITMHKQTETT
jgi:hypothetical protein